MALWKNISSEALDLVVKMTECDQYRRLSAKECLSHPWFSTAQSPQKFLTCAMINLKEIGTDHQGQEHIKEITRKVGLNTASPLFSKRTLPRNSSQNVLPSGVQADSPLFKEESRTPVPTVHSRSSLFSIIRSKVNDSKATLSKFKQERVEKTTRSDMPINPFTNAILSAEENKEAEGNNEDDDYDYRKFSDDGEDEGNDEIPDERDSAVASGTVRSFTKSFMPEIDEIRKIPCLTWPEGVSKRLLLKSTHFTKRPLGTEIYERIRKVNKTCMTAEEIKIASNSTATDLPVLPVYNKTSIKETKDSETTPRSETMPRKINWKEGLKTKIKL